MLCYVLYARLLQERDKRRGFVARCDDYLGLLQVRGVVDHRTEIAFLHGLLLRFVHDQQAGMVRWEALPRLQRAKRQFGPFCNPNTRAIVANGRRKHKV